MEIIALGNTGLQVTRLGVGLSEIGSELTFDEVEQASALLNAALDRGVNFLDTADFRRAYWDDGGGASG